MFSPFKLPHKAVNCDLETLVTPIMSVMPAPHDFLFKQQQGCSEIHCSIIIKNFLLKESIFCSLLKHKNISLTQTVKLINDIFLVVSRGAGIFRNLR